jgi:predicted RecA/RadA family phage recombinase
MSTKFIQEGEILTVAAPTGGVTSGLPVVIGDLAGVPVATAAVGVDFGWRVEGVHSVVKSGSAGPAFAVGDPVYWTGALATTSSAYPLIGVATAAAGASATSVSVRLTGAAKRLFGRMTAAGTQLNSQDSSATAYADTLSIPAGSLRSGDLLIIRALIKVDDNNSTNTLANSLRLGGVTVGTQAAHDVDDADGIYLEAECFFQTAGASGRVPLALHRARPGRQPGHHGGLRPGARHHRGADRGPRGDVVGRSRGQQVARSRA